MEFRTEVADASIRKKDTEGVTAQVWVNWNCEIEAREWGIKSIGYYVTSVALAVEEEHYVEADDDYITKEYELVVEDGVDGWKVEEQDTDTSITDMVTIQNIEIDLDKKEVSICF